MKYIQSFYQYPVTFSSIGKTIPARSAMGDMKNIAEVTEKELERIRNSEPFFRELLDKKKIRVLDHIPSSYIPASEQINAANAEADKLREENERLKAQLEAKNNKAEDVADEPAEEEVPAEEKPAENKPKQKTTKKK